MGASPMGWPGVLTRLVLAVQLLKGSTHEKGKLVYQLRVDNASPGS